MQSLSQSFISFLDSDDHWPADFIERTLSRLCGRPDCVLATVDRSFDNGARRACPARRWYLAGKGLSKEGRREEARVCYARSLLWNPWGVKTWKRRLGI